MGGWGSGRQGGRPTKENSLVVDLGLMLRSGWIRDGASGSGLLRWLRNDEEYATTSHRYDMRDPNNASLTLIYRRRRYGEDWTSREQRIRLSYTVPPYGGRRWWMLCPVNGDRIGKLYLPSGGDIFAGRRAWRIAYQSQRITERDRVFEALFRLQRKLGCTQGWEQPIMRPKGMWRRTFERFEDEYWDLDARCGVEMMSALSVLRGLP